MNNGTTPASAAVTADDAAGLARQRERNTQRLATATGHVPKLSDAVIGAYLRSPQQALPPEPGVDAAAVLAHSLAARYRRGLRDLVLLVFSLVMGVALYYADAGLVWFWLGFIAVWLLVRLLARVFRRRRGAERLRAGVAHVIVAFLLWSLLASELEGPLDDAFDIDDSLYALPDSPLSSLLVIAWLAGLFAVLVSDQLLVSGGTDSPVARLGKAVRTVGTRRHGRLLGEMSARPDSGNVLVQSGWSAFPGHGDRLNQWSMVIPLHKEGLPEGEAGGADVRPLDLYRAVAAELRQMHTSDLLVPGSRLRGLTVDPVVAVHAGTMSAHAESPLGRTLLPDRGERPVPAVAPELVEQIADRGPEWARHFQRSSVAGWESDVVVSTFFHVGCDDRTLYLEWSAYCLLPIDSRHSGPAASGGSVRAAALELLRFPSSLPSRVRTAAGGLRRMVLPENGASREADYGSVQSIREVVAATEFGNEFQELDGLRYVKLIERRTLSAVHRHLHDNGFSTDEFEARRNAVINTTVINGGTFTGANTFGANSAARVETANAAQPAEPQEES